MKRNIKKVIILTLILCFLFSSFNISYSFQYANKDSNLPSGILWEDPETKLRLNLDLFEDLDIVVYGNHTMVGKNNFKVKSGGYYTNDKGERGEYRYHGYTLGGSVYANANFPEDEVMTKAENTYRYIPRIWEQSNKKYYNAKRLREPSAYTYTATSDKITPLTQSLYQTKINNSAPYALTNPLYVYGDGEFYNYANVETMPTYYNSGDFRLDHLATYKDGSTKLWYVCNSLKRDTVPKKHSTVYANFIGEPIFKT